MAAWVATYLDLALGGIAASAMVPDARQLAAMFVDNAHVAPTVFELPGHGFADATAVAAGYPAALVRFGDANGIQLDSAISPTTYYTVSVAPGDPDFFTLANPAGAPLVLTGDGDGEPWVLENIIPRINLVMARWTSDVVANAKAYKAPWSVPPAWAPQLIAQLAAPTVCEILRVASARFAVPDVQANFDRAWKQFLDLQNGVPMDDGTGPIDAATVPGDPGIATNAVAHGQICGVQFVTGFL